MCVHIYYIYMYISVCACNEYIIYDDHIRTYYNVVVFWKHCQGHRINACDCLCK